MFFTRAAHTNKQKRMHFAKALFILIKNGFDMMIFLVKYRTPSHTDVHGFQLILLCFCNDCYSKRFNAKVLL